MLWGGRIVWVDIFKGMLMLLIILSHTGGAEIYGKFYTPVFLSGYFWISGYLTKSGRDFKHFILSKLKGLIIPFCSLGIINAVIAIIVESDAISNRVQFLISRRYAWDDLWFIACLFSAQCIFWGVEKICLSIDKNRTKKYWRLLLLFTSAIAMIARLYIRIINFSLPFQFENACISSLFIALGFLFKHLESKIYISYSIFCTINFILYLALIVIFDNNVSVHNAQYGSFIIYTLSAISGIFVLTTLCMNIENNLHLKNIIRILEFIGQNTLVYYAFQSKIIKVLNIVAEFLFLPKDAYIFPLVVTVITASVLFIPAFIMNRFFPVLVGKKRKS